jgi:hypothetical protein
VRVLCAPSFILPGKSGGGKEVGARRLFTVDVVLNLLTTKITKATKGSDIVFDF